MPYRKTPLVTGSIYHIFTKSIAGFKIFNSDSDFERIIKAKVFYSTENPPCKFSLFLKEKNTSKTNNSIKGYYQHKENKNKIVRIIAYCIMPTHIHLILEQLKDGAISHFLNLILKSYSKYFNLKYKRKGPLWEGRFKNILIDSDEYFLHLSRYIHLNPTSASLVERPENWKFSSYQEYTGGMKENRGICSFSECMDMGASSYKRFVEDNIDYQKTLGRIKHLLLE